MKRVLVTGANGYLASLVYHMNQDAFEWIRMTRKDADFSDPDAVEAWIRKQEFDICFHTAANANTAFCNEHPDLAEKINVESTKRIVDVCDEKGALLIFSSSEQVFNGRSKRGPFHEDEEPYAVTVYGQNKIACEKYIHEHLKKAIILRYSWQLGLSQPDVKASPNLAANVMKALLHQQPTLFTCNEKRCLTYAKHLALAFSKIVTLAPGTYHVAASNELTTYEAAVYIAKKLGATQKAIDTYILPNHERYQDRFRDFRLDASKLEALGISFGTFEDHVDELLNDFGWHV